MKQKLISLLALLVMAATGAVAQDTYKVTVKEGTVDAANWTLSSGAQTVQGDAEEGLTGLKEGDQVTLKYGGEREVKSIKAVKKEAPATGTDLSMVDCAGTARTDGQWTANCYMVHTAGDYKLPLVYGNAIKAGADNTAAYTGINAANSIITTTRTFPHSASPCSSTH